MYSTSWNALIALQEEADKIIKGGRERGKENIQKKKKLNSWTRLWSDLFNKSVPILNELQQKRQPCFLLCSEPNEPNKTDVNATQAAALLVSQSYIRVTQCHLELNTKDVPAMVTDKVSHLLLTYFAELAEQSDSSWINWCCCRKFARASELYLLWERLKCFGASHATRNLTSKQEF